MDQRGTGHSSPVTSQTLELKFGDDVKGKGEYLRFFRATEIVEDAEAFRDVLNGGGRWGAVLGQR